MERTMALSRAGKFFADFREFCKTKGYPDPHLSVSDPVPDKRLVEPEPLLEDFQLYTRVGGHPHHHAIEDWLTRFESGAAFRIRCDGMSAIGVMLRAALKDPKRRHVILVRPLYGGTDMLGGENMEENLPHDSSVTYLSAFSYGFLHYFADALLNSTAAVFCEIPGNPTYPIPDIAAMRVILDRLYPSNLRPIFIVDNTSSFALVHPFKHGADAIAASGTKFLAGESSCIIGYCGVSKGFFEEHPAFWKYVGNVMSRGGTAGILDTYVVAHFSLDDVYERVIAHSKNALAVARFLKQHPTIQQVVYPGLLDSYRWRTLADRYFEPIRGERVYGGMIACYLRGADLATTNRFLLHLQKGGIPFKASFGGPRTMTASPMLLTHRGINKGACASCGITENLIRISVGREENPQEIIDAFEHSLTALRTGTLPCY